MEKSKQIELTDEEKEVLRKHHEAKKKALLAELASTDTKIQEYGGPTKDKSQINITFAPSEFKKAKSVPARVLYVIKDLGKPSTISEIVDRYALYDTSVKKDGKVVRKKYAHIYGAVLSKVKSQDVLKIQEKGKNLKYGLPSFKAIENWLATHTIDVSKPPKVADLKMPWD